MITLFNKEYLDLLSLVVSDNQTGNNYLRPRSDEYWEVRAQINSALKTEKKTCKQEILCRLYKENEDYEFYHSLEKDDRLT